MGRPDAAGQAEAGEVGGEERGVDVDLSYAFDIGSLGKIRTALVGTYIDRYEVQPIANAPNSAFNCVGLYGATCSSFVNGAGIPVFRWRNTLRVSLFGTIKNEAADPNAT